MSQNSWGLCPSGSQNTFPSNLKGCWRSRGCLKAHNNLPRAQIMAREQLIVQKMHLLISSPAQLSLPQPFCKARLSHILPAAPQPRGALAAASPRQSGLPPPSLGSSRTSRCQGHVGAGITCPCACSGKPQSLCFELLRPWGAPALENLGMNPFAPVQRYYF